MQQPAPDQTSAASPYTHPKEIVTEAFVQRRKLLTIETYRRSIAELVETQVGSLYQLYRTEATNRSVRVEKKKLQQGLVDQKEGVRILKQEENNYRAKYPLAWPNQPKNPSHFSNFPTSEL